MAKKIVFTETEQAEIARIQQAFGISRKAAIRKMRSANKKSEKAAKTQDFKSAAANDKSETVAAPKKTKKAKKPVAPKKLTSTEAGAARAAGMKLFALAGRPTKSDFIKLCGKKGPAMTWTARAEHLGVATLEEAAEKFAALKAGK